MKSVHLKYSFRYQHFNSKYHQVVMGGHQKMVQTKKSIDPPWIDTVIFVVCHSSEVKLERFINQKFSSFFILSLSTKL